MTLFNGNTMTSNFDPSFDDKVLFILRGVPGCGKTTLANYLYGFSMVGEMFAADDFFIKEGTYQFDASKLGEAHKWCREQVEDAMIDGVGPLILHNTSTTEKELEPYLALAEKYGYNIFSLVVENRHGNKNVHSVPEESLKKMEARLRDSIKLQ